MEERNNRQKMHQNDKGQPNRTKRKRNRPFVLIVLLVLILLFAIAVLIFWAVSNARSDANSLERSYYAAVNETLPVYTDYLYEKDFDEDIFEDVQYTSMNRTMLFDFGAQSIRLNLDDNLSSYGTDVSFFADYFSTVIRGDYESYIGFFDDSYAENDYNMPLPTEPFTMQRLYDIEVTKHSDTQKTTDDGKTYTYYSVSYKILKNNGSFRNDIREGQARVLSFRLCQTDSGIQISQIQPKVELQS